MDWFWIVVLVVIGFILVVLELLIPSGGLISVLAAGVFLAAVALAFSQSTTTGIVVLALLVVGLPVAVLVGLYLWVRTPLGKGFILEAPKPDEIGDEEDREKRLRELVGRTGVALTPLRPAGIVEIDGKRFDTIADGVMVEPGTRVKVVRVDGVTVVVRPIDEVVA